MMTKTAAPEQRAGHDTAALSGAGVEGYEELFTLGRDNVEGLTRASRAVLDGTSELNQVWTTYWNEQFADGIDALRALGQCRTWHEALEIHNEFTRASVERTCARAARSAELTAAMITGSLDPLHENARKAAERLPRPAS